MEVGRVLPHPYSPFPPKKRNIEYRKNMSAIALLSKCGPEMFKQLLQSWQWPSSGTSIPLAEESMGLREVSTCHLTRPYFTLSTNGPAPMAPNIFLEPAWASSPVTGFWPPTFQWIPNWLWGVGPQDRGEQSPGPPIPCKVDPPQVCAPKVRLVARELTFIQNCPSYFFSFPSSLMVLARL